MQNSILRGAIALSLLALTACSMPSKQVIGAGAGGVAGGVLGAQVGGGSGRTAAIIGGSLLGAYAGGKIGGQLDERDALLAQQAFENTPTGTSSSWSNPDTGNRYQMTPTRTYQNAYSEPCRDYTMLVMMDGKSETVRGSACRNSNGSWVDSANNL